MALGRSGKEGGSNNTLLALELGKTIVVGKGRLALRQTGLGGGLVEFGVTIDLELGVGEVRDVEGGGRGLVSASRHSCERLPVLGSLGNRGVSVDGREGSSLSEYRNFEF